MNRFLANRIALVMFGTFAFAGVTVAQEPEPAFVISSSRSHGSVLGVSEEVVSASQRVSYADLNLASASGSREMEERVKSTARTLCEKLDQRYPLSNVDVEACARNAASKGIADVRAAAAAAEKKARTASIASR